MAGPSISHTASADFEFLPQVELWEHARKYS